MNDSEEQGVRIQILIARAGLASRRAAESLILDGRVSVNGRVITELGARARPEDRVCVDGKALEYEERKLYLLLNKPAGYLCSSSDKWKRPLAQDLLRPGVTERVFHVGRLDMDSSGLVIFTNDGDFSYRAGHPSFGIEKEYLIETDKIIPDSFPGLFESGIKSLDKNGEEETLRAQKAHKTGEKTLTVILVEGRNREIRRALREFGLRAAVLERVAIGPVRKGNLALGAYRELSKKEIEFFTGVK